MQTNSNVGRHLHHKISLLKDTGILINILSQLEWTHSDTKTSKHPASDPPLGSQSRRKGKEKKMQTIYDESWCLKSLDDWNKKHKTCFIKLELAVSFFPKMFFRIQQKSGQLLRNI